MTCKLWLKRLDDPICLWKWHHLTLSSTGRINSISNPCKDLITKFSKDNTFDWSTVYSVSGQANKTGIFFPANPTYRCPHNQQIRCPLYVLDILQSREAMLNIAKQRDVRVKDHLIVPTTAWKQPKIRTHNLIVAIKSHPEINGFVL